MDIIAVTKEQAAAENMKLLFVITAPCGHAIKEAKYAGTPSWQNCWTCQKCGKKFSR